jgi:hypothetical protein
VRARNLGIVGISLLLTAQTPALTLELVVPSRGTVVRAPLTQIVWRLSVPADAPTWSIRAGDVDLSPFVQHRAREFRAILPPELALGHGTHRISADVCVSRGGACVTHEVLLEVLTSDSKSGKGSILDAFIRILREIVISRGNTSN